MKEKVALFSSSTSRTPLASFRSAKSDLCEKVGSRVRRRRKRWKRQETRERNIPTSAPREFLTHSPFSPTSEMKSAAAERLGKREGIRVSGAVRSPHSNLACHLKSL